MAFSFGNLLATAASARAGARRGQREQQQLDAEAERQARLDQFNEYARSRQLAQTDNAQQNAMERAQEQIAAREAIAARDADIRNYKAREDARLAQEKLNRESGMDQTDPTKGYRGADRGAKIQMNDADNQTALTKAQIAAATAAARAANAQANGITGAQKLTQVSQMRDDFQKDAPIAAAQKLATVTNQLKAALAGESAMDDLSLVYETIKMFDPQTGVREGETTIFANSASLDERARRLLLNWNKGRRLTDSMRADIRELVKRKELAAAALEKPVQARYGERLRRYGLEADSAFVAPSAFSGVSPTAGSPQPAETPEQRKARLQREARGKP